MSAEIYLNEAYVVANDSKQIATGPLATEAKQSEANLSAAAIKTAVQNGDYVVSSVYTATIGASSIIPTAFTATLPANTVRVILVPQGDVYYKVGGAASASTAKVPGGGLNMPVTKVVADTVQVFAASVVCDLLVCIPRN